MRTVVIACLLGSVGCEGKHDGNVSGPMKNMDGSRYEDRSKGGPEDSDAPDVQGAANTNAGAATPPPPMDGQPGRGAYGMTGDDDGFARGHRPESNVRPAADPEGQGGSNNTPEVGPPSANGEITPRPAADRQ